MQFHTNANSFQESLGFTANKIKPAGESELHDHERYIFL